MTLNDVWDNADASGEVGGRVVAEAITEAFEDGTALTGLAADMDSIISWATQVRDAALTAAAQEPDFCQKCGAPDAPMDYNPEEDVFICPVCHEENTPVPVAPQTDPPKE